jgi:Spy/CpxP family protein refolding chaperone
MKTQLIFLAALLAATATNAGGQPSQDSGRAALGSVAEARAALALSEEQKALRRQAAQARKDFAASLSPEQRQALAQKRERLQSLTPEQRQKLRERLRERRAEHAPPR